MFCVQMLDFRHVETTATLPCLFDNKLIHCVKTLKKSVTLSP